MKISDIQTAILEQTGLKTSAKKNTGSMKNYITIWPIFQNGQYAKFDHSWVKQFVIQFKSFGDITPIGSTSQIDIPVLNITDKTPIVYKKESKPKPTQELTSKGWGSKNSQMRLDKKSASYAKKLRQDQNRARYY